MRQLEALRRRIATGIQNVINVAVKVTLVEPKTIERSSGKAVRVKDLRGITVNQNK